MIHTRRNIWTPASNGRGRFEAGLRTVCCGVALLVSLSIPPAASAGERPMIRLWPRATVGDATVRLRDVADIRGFDEQETDRLRRLIVKEELADGRSVDITGADIREVLNAGRVNLALVRIFGAARCRVERPAILAPVEAQPKPEPQETVQVAPKPEPEAVTRRGKFVEQVPEGTLEAHLNEYIRARTASLEGEIKIRLNKAARDRGYLSFTDDEYRFSIHDDNKNLLGMLNLEVDLYRDNHVVGTIPIVATVSLLKRVVVARRPINRGVLINTADLNLEVQEFRNEKEIGTADMAVLVGNQARRFLPRGRRVTMRDVKPMPLVRRNALVDVYVEGGTYRIKTSAKALEEGSYGQTIQVRSPATGERFFVIVTGPGTTKLPTPERSTKRVTKPGSDSELAWRAES